MDLDLDQAAGLEAGRLEAGPHLETYSLQLEDDFVRQILDVDHLEAAFFQAVLAAGHTDSEMQLDVGICADLEAVWTL